MPGSARTRITAGEYRGRQVLTPAGIAVRPTTSLVRQALFNILGDAIPGSAVIDLYAGAGTVGFEALSRGAASAVFVERDRAVASLIGVTAERLGCSGRCRVVVADVAAWLRRRPAEVATADLGYLDAPYRDDQVDESLRLLAEAPPALVVCEHHRARTLPEQVGRLRRVREASYGTTRLTLWRRSNDQDSGGDGDR